MSLVVAEATDDGPRIVSDTRVVFPAGQRSSYKNGTLKAIVIARNVTICFAGDVVAGLAGVREFARGLGEGRLFDDLLLKLQVLTSDNRRMVEFIVVNVDADSHLTRIRNGEIERDLQSAWIGDKQGFERFQAERLKQPDSTTVWVESALSPAARVMTKLQRAMKAVIDDPAIESVDDFCVSVAYRPTGFDYLESTFVQLGRDVRIESGENILSRMVQPVEEGGYAVSVVPPAEPGTPALGLNFPQARLGILYLPLEFDDGQVISDISPNDFAKIVLERFNVTMIDPLLRYVQR